MQQLAPGVMQLDGRPKNSINSYLVEDVLIDSGAFFSQGAILKQLEGVSLSAHAITHAHFDHVGAAAAVAERHGVPVWIGEKDASAVERGKQIGHIPGLGEKYLPSAAKVAVDRVLKEGDVVAGFTVLDTPGHSPGHVSFWRESDKVLICGDVMWGYNPFTMRGRPRDPFALLSPDPKLNRQSARRLAELRPELVCFGHGPPLRDPDRFVDAVSRLAA